jgi:4'-phosphopantetheinyl transferase
LLDQREQRRALALGSARSSRRFVAGRSALRIVLGAALGRAPHEVPIVYGELGKPQLDGGSHLSFNLAHHAGTAVIALSTGGSIGVDIETVRPHTSVTGIAERFFDRGETELIARLRDEPRDAAFLRCWTVREAVLKATGTGLSGSIRAVAVSTAPPTPVRLSAVPLLEPRDWSVHELSLIRGRLRVAVAVPAPAVTLAGVHRLELRDTLGATSEAVARDLART